MLCIATEFLMVLNNLYGVLEHPSARKLYNLTFLFFWMPMRSVPSFALYFSFFLLGFGCEHTTIQGEGFCTY